MGWKIVKFGGSILSSKENMKRIVKLVNRYGHNTIYIVSALRGITDSIINFMSRVESDKSVDVTSFCDRFYLSHIKFLEEFEIRDKKAYQEIKNISESLKSRFLEMINGNLSDFLKADVLHFGEKASSLLFFHMMKHVGIEIKIVFPEEIGLQTIDEDEFMNSTIDFSWCEKNLYEHFKDGIFVIPGFYGITPKGRIALLGRNGSDYSASAIAACINADFLDIYKDVSGFMTCDPKLLTGGKTVSHLTYEEAAELSHFGAKILHPLSIEPVRRKGIPIRIYDIRGSGFMPETLISSQRIDAEFPVKSITHSNVSIIRIKGGNIGKKLELLSGVTRRLSRHGVRIKSLITSQTSVNVIVPSDDVEKCVDLLRKEKASWLESIEYKDGVSLIALVGEKLLDSSDFVFRVSKAIFKAKINVEMVSLGSSKNIGYFVVSGEDAKKCLHAIHREFISKKSRRRRNG